MIVVRKAELKDVPYIGKMGAGMIRFHHALDPKRFFLTENPDEGYAWWLGEEIANPEAVILVAEKDGGEIVGYTYGTLDETNWSILLGPHAGFHDIWVAESERKSGIGRELVRATLAAFKELGAPQVILMTSPQNLAAQRLAEEFGFRQTMIEMTREL